MVRPSCASAVCMLPTNPDIVVVLLPLRLSDFLVLLLHEPLHLAVGCLAKVPLVAREKLVQSGKVVPIVIKRLHNLVIR